MEVKDLIPPVIVKLLKREQKQLKPKTFRSYEEAIEYCPGKAYEDEELCSMVADKTMIHSQKLKSRPVRFTATNAFLLAAINQYLVKYKKRELRILDLGGACGAHYFEIGNCIPEEVSLKWTVVETPGMVRAAKAVGLNDPELDFVSSVDEVTGDIDIIHSSCALQYVPDAHAKALALTRKNAPWIFFNRMMFNQNDKDITIIQSSLLSENGPGKMPEKYKERLIQYPHTTLAFGKFNKLFEDNGYRLEWMFEESTGSFHLPDEKIIGRGLLYVKK